MKILLTRLVWLLLFCLGLGSRVLPLFDQGGRLLAQWPTEDGYFMLTMGRNIALGRGMSVAGGEILTNGTQPLTTLLWGSLFAVFGPDRVAGVRAVLVFEVLVASLTAWLVYRLGRRLSGQSERSTSRSAFAALIWFASPLVVPHSMNCLETGVYGLFVVLVASFFVQPETEPKLFGWPKTCALGVLLGAAFWARNDAAFVIAACSLLYLGPGLGARRAELTPRLLRVLTFGSLSVLVATPWLYYNVTRFGHLMPVSGRAESLTGTFAGNLKHLPVALVEYVGLAFPIPSAISGSPFVVFLAILVVAAAGVSLYAFRAWFTVGEVRLGQWLGLIVLGFVGFYGFFFGAAWFLPRYFFPLSPLVFLLLVGLFAEVQARVLRPRFGAGKAEFAVGFALVLVIGSVGVNAARQYRRGSVHQHFQVVDWVRANVEEATWVGAIQTGTLGFFHDRTINLDGKVNLRAYEALIAHREGEYVAHETEIRYLADWVGMRDWLDKPAIAEHFALLVDDPARNLVVLERRVVPKSAEAGTEGAAQREAMRGR